MPFEKRLNAWLRDLLSAKRLYAWLTASSILTFCFAASLWSVQINRQDPSAGVTHLRSLWPYWICFTSAWLGLTVVACKLYRSRAQSADTASRLSPAGWILAIALIARLITWIGGPPQLSDDLWRYIQDGRQLATGTNPYTNTPAELSFSHHSDPILEQVNHPDLVTIYQPTSQYVFSLLWLAHPERWDPLGHYTFRMGFILLDVGVINLLILSLSRKRRSPWWAVLYAWHPLVISEVAASGHQDVIGIGFLMASFLAADCDDRSIRRALITGISFAAAIAVKPIVVPLSLPIAWRLRREASYLILTASAALATLILLYLPLILLGEGMGRLTETASAFVHTWAFNSSLHGLTAWIVANKSVADIVMAIVLIATLLTCTARKQDLWQVAVVFLFALVLLSSTAYPWYLLWALAFLPLRFNRALWILSWTISWSYAVLGDISAWRLPWWLVAAEYLPVYAILGYEMIRWLKLPRGTPAT